MGKQTVTGTCLFYSICVKLVNIKNKTTLITYYICYSQKAWRKKLFEKMRTSKKTTIKLSRKYRFKGGLHGRIFLKINTIFNAHMLYYQYSFMYVEREFSKTNVLNLFFLLIFLLRWINSNKFELIHLHKSMKHTPSL